MEFAPLSRISFYGIRCLKNEIVNAGEVAKIALLSMRQLFPERTPFAD
jgi:hypothetical protein